MPLSSLPFASGNPQRLLHCSKYLKWPALSIGRIQSWLPSARLRPITCLATFRTRPQRFTDQARPDTPRTYSDCRTAAIDGADTRLPNDLYDGFVPQLSNRRRKRQRPSRPAELLRFIQNPERHLYAPAPVDKVDLSYQNSRRFRLRGTQRRAWVLASKSFSAPSQPVSLYTILGRYLAHQITPDAEKKPFVFEMREKRLLDRKGFSTASVEKWATSLSHSRTNMAVELFQATDEKPPLFLLLLFLRRNHMTVFAFSVVLKHLHERRKTDQLEWNALKTLCTRMLRIARKLRPAAMSWIAKLFTVQVASLLPDAAERKASRLLSDVTFFSNTMLHLLSLPSSYDPLYAAHYQEEAQFHILQFMASATPPIIVTRVGFRSVTRIQLAHAKTQQESEWAKLKGPSWPPWKENRTAMDEDKSYEFGMSRASKVMQRMYEAGYAGRNWEAVAELYAGWDTDLSPTIQTRTSLPQFTSKYQDHARLKSLLWAGRVRATRSRREAWACFLAYEATGARISQAVYLAMFEKLHYPESRQSLEVQTQSELDDIMKDIEKPRPSLDSYPLPGGMKEILPDPTSPQNYVYLSEPLPTINGLFHRLQTRNARPLHHLLAFLLEIAPDFGLFLNILSVARSDFDGGIGQLLDGRHDDHTPIGKIPNYLLTAFLSGLCKFGHYHHPPLDEPTLLSPEEHVARFRCERQYLLHYAQALLLHYKPMHCPAWAVYMGKVVRSKMDFTGQDLTGGFGMPQFRIVCKLIEVMESIELDVDDKIFSLVCGATAIGMRAANKGNASIEDTRFVLQTGSSRLHRLFTQVTGETANEHTSEYAGSSPVHPHMPGPAVIHAYVRALGMLRDYNGLLNLAHWLTRHHEQFTKRVQVQHGGIKHLQRTIVAFRAALTGRLDIGTGRRDRAPEDITQTIRTLFGEREEWGGWPSHQAVDIYVGRWKLS